MSDSERLEEWIEANPDAYAWFLERAALYVERGHRFSAKELAEGYRWSALPAGVVRKYKWNNTLTAALARRIVRDLPAAKRLIETRRARCDAEAVA